MADMKVEVVLSQIASNSGDELSSPVWSAYKKLQNAVKSVCMVYDVWFQRLLETVGQSSKDIIKGGLVAACSPQYSTQIAELPK